MPKVMEAVGLPRTVEAARMVLGKMQVMLKAGVAPDLQVAAKAAAQELEQRNFALLRQLPPERLRDMLGKDTYAALLKLSVAQVQPSQPAQQKPPAQPADKKPKAWLSQREWDKQYLGE
jgi:hypothetical protein